MYITILQIIVLLVVIIFLIALKNDENKEQR